MPSKVLYIMSLPHSGSTLMELLINAHFHGVTSLGEVHPTFLRRKEIQKTCTCGKPKVECRLWKEVDFQATEDFGTFYANVLTAASSDCVTDSSKSLDVFKRNHMERRDDFIVVFLRKNLVSYYQSAMRRKRRESGALRRMVKHHPVRVVLGWLYHNHRMSSFLRSARITHMTATYEDLCDRTGSLMAQLSPLCGMRLKREPAIENAHLLRGNRMRHEFVNKPVVRPYQAPAGHGLYPVLARIDAAFNRGLAAR